MRNNQPVSGKERPYPSGRVIISRTNAKGQITHVNAAFIEISGYEKSELIGQPHNMLRHPDMPAEAFRDLWATLKAGRPWTGIVKNRCKNGDHYWVRAAVTCLPNGEGYMSVRTEASRAEIQHAEALYARPGLHLEAGNSLPGGWLGKLVAFNRHVRLAWRFWATFIVFTALMLLGEGIALYGQRTLGLGMIAFAMLAGIAMFAAMISYLTRNMVRTRELLRGIAESGDLSVPLPVNMYDEIGEVLTQIVLMRSKLHELVADLVDRIESMTPQAHSLDEAAGEGSRASLRQSKSAAAMAAAVEEMSVSVDQVRDLANESREIAIRTEELAQSGGQVIRQAAEEISLISSTVQQAVEAVTTLQSHSEQITNTVQVIREIADQTNLLALNAAIEAARAGESGRGFAVVADEVRKLAERTSGSTHQISQMVDMIQQGTHSVANGMQASTARVTEGVALAGRAGEAITEIQTAVVSAADAVSAIFDALKEQAVAAHEIASRVEEIATDSEQGTHAAEQTSDSAKALSDLTDEMHQLAQRFRIS
ncbi:PAS domain-containing methyl-accepting chemotaxis protein [Uliginosibacterium sp. 31-16]|uniref:methyl-accepting chemotaxis protein n=1 Tax=Uliginosibacterium sp. 31-16 TaxID=3068315 RepID=UPI00273D44C0|nr:PAS domain-containing methyl-accepting chemotaxis protein [Uliginosibacterium sp. 31-16]MDP5239346.1 PAS domain-containing methyl-accepting chemotaxis protein [Uliginosibacterium sp. 31-16]